MPIIGECLQKRMWHSIVWPSPHYIVLYDAFEVLQKVSFLFSLKLDSCSALNTSKKKIKAHFTSFVFFVDYESVWGVCRAVWACSDHPFFLSVCSRPQGTLHQRGRFEILSDKISIALSALSLWVSPNTYEHNYLWVMLITYDLLHHISILEWFSEDSCDTENCSFYILKCIEMEVF